MTLLANLLFGDFLDSEAGRCRNALDLDGRRDAFRPDCASPMKARLM